MFTLGRAYLKLAQELYINLPAVGKKALTLYSNIYHYYYLVRLIMVLILSFHLICDKVVKLVYNYNTESFHRICATNYLFPRGVILHVGCDITPQGAKKVIFTACHLGKLKQTFTSPKHHFN